MKSQSNPKATLQEQINTLNEQYYQYYRSLMAMERDKTLYTEVNNEKIPTLQGVELTKKLLSMLGDCKNILEKNNSEAPLIYIKIVILYGHQLAMFAKYNDAFEHYVRAIQYLKNNKHLRYEQDVFFQQEVNNAFIEINAILDLRLNQHVHSKQTKHTQKIIAKLIEQKNAVDSMHAEFKPKCKKTIVGLMEKFNNLCALYSDGYMENDDLTSLNKRYKNERDDFFDLARKIKSPLEIKKMNGSFNLADKIQYLRLNFFMLQISEITHPRSIWKIIRIQNQYAFTLIDPLANETLNDFLKYWLSLKELFIKPSISLIEKISADEINSQMELYYLCKSQLNKWLAYFHMPSLQLLTITTEMIKLIDSGLKLPINFYRDLCEFIIKWQPEIEYLLSCITIIQHAAMQHGHEFESRLTDASNILFEKNPGLSNEINDLKTNIQVLEKKKLQLSVETADELIREEEEQKALHNEKIKKRKPLIEHVPILQQKIEESDSEDEIESDTLILINDELLELQDIDKNAYDLAYHLRSNSLSLCKMLKSRLGWEVPLTYNQHQTVFNKINYMLAEYYQLITLYEKHTHLSQRNTERDLQDGILYSQDELKKISLSIHENIQTVIQFIHKIKKLQKTSRDKLIYELGVNYVKHFPHIDFTHDQIMQHGREEFKYIGKNKSDVSEHTKLRRFLDICEYPLSGLLYLQEKIKPFIFENCNKTYIDIGLFSREKTHGKSAELSEGRFHGLLGIIFQGKFNDSNDIIFLSEARTHFQTAYNAFSREENDVAMQEMIERLAVVNNLIMQNNSVNNTMPRI